MPGADFSSKQYKNQTATVTRLGRMTPGRDTRALPPTTCEVEESGHSKIDSTWGGHPPGTGAETQLRECETTRGLGMRQTAGELAQRKGV
jgi:hypothetical protein